MQPRFSRPLRLSGTTSRLYLGPTSRGQWSASSTTTSHRLQSSTSTAVTGVQRPFSSSTISPSSSPSPSQPSPKSTPAPNARWIDDLRLRIGKCITFGCDSAQVARSARVLAAISAEWRDLLAGSHGFVTPGSLDPGSPLAAATGEAESDGSGARRNTKMGLLNHAVAWGDMDSFGHVNNTVYNKWAESARVNWLLHFAALDLANAAQWRQLMTMKHIGFIMQSITTKYKMPIVYPDTISVYYRLTSSPVLGSPDPPSPSPSPSSSSSSSGEPPAPTTATNLNLQSLILSHKHRRIAATTDESVVIYNYQTASKTNLPQFAAPLMARTWESQRAAADRAQARIADLVAQVERLEKETWDREGAVEDFGGGARKP